jgi:hypothetical protein
MCVLPAARSYRVNDSLLLRFRQSFPVPECSIGWEWQDTIRDGVMRQPTVPEGYGPPPPRISLCGGKSCAVRSKGNELHGKSFHRWKQSGSDNGQIRAATA